VRDCGLDLGGLVAEDARLDSLGDSAETIGALMDWFGRTGARLVSADIGLDTATWQAVLSASALSAAGQLERRKLQERTRQARKLRWRIFAGGRA
jgi:DNA invertase Pin-like site-specific DNA recombinase